jgi:hypothetical protein
MPDNPVTAIGKLEIPHLGKKRLGLDLDRLRQQFARPGAKHIRQWIIKLVRLTKANNVDSLGHGVSLSSRGSGRLHHPPHMGERRVKVIHRKASAILQNGIQVLSPIA